MSDLVAWLTKILDEDEAAARFTHDLAATIDYGVVDFQWVRFVRDIPGGMVRSHSFDTGAPSPAAVLADIAAKRAIIALHDGRPVDLDSHVVCTECRHQIRYPCETMRLLASAYADRPGCDESWRP